MKNGVIFQSFEWYTPKDPHLWVTLKEKASALAQAGFSAIWLPPAYKGIGGENDDGYGAYDLYDLGEFDAHGSIRTKYGTRQEYLDCIKALQDAGIDVYGDIVLDHKMGADENEMVSAKEVNASDRYQVVSNDQQIEVATKFTFPARHGKYSAFTWNWEDFDGIDYDIKGHKHADFLFDSKSWNNGVDDENGNFDYLMGADLDFSVPEVREECINWGKWYYDTTHLDGFRLDAVKHISSDFYKEWLSAMRDYTKREMFTVGEYWHGDLGHLIHYLIAVNYAMSLFDVPLHYNFYNASHSNGLYDMRRIFDGTLVSFSSDHVVTFVDNHDTQPSQGLQSFIDDWFKPQAYALILLRQAGYPCVFAGDYDGIPHDGIASKKDLIDEMLDLRMHHMSGAMHDYLDHPDLIGWSFEGENTAGFVVLLTNARGGKKRMYVGTKYANETFYDGTHYVNISQNGEGIFLVNDGSLSIYHLEGEETWH